MAMKRVVGLTLGSPFDPTSRSGVNNEVFTRLGKQFNLTAYDCSLRGGARTVSIMRSFSWNMVNWRRRSHQNPYAFEQRSSISDRILEQYGGQYDAIYQDGAMFIPRTNRKLFITNHDANVILTARGGTYSVGSHYAVDSSLLAASIRQEREVYDRADRIFVRSHWVKESLVRDFSVDENKIRVNPSGVHLEDVPAGEKTYRGVNILFVGKDTPLKGYDVLLKAFELLLKQNPRLVLHVAGNSRPAKDTENIKHYGFLGQGQKHVLRDLYLKADLLILPSRYDAFPKVLIEAGAFKVPCIATAVGGVPEIVEHGENGFLVPAGNPEAIARYAHEVLTCVSLSRQMGEKGYANFKLKFNWDRHVRLISEFINANC